RRSPGVPDTRPAPVCPGRRTTGRRRCSRPPAPACSDPGGATLRRSRRPRPARSGPRRRCAAPRTRPRAGPGTARGCRRSCRSCRPPAPAYSTTYCAAGRLLHADVVEWQERLQPRGDDEHQTRHHAESQHHGEYRADRDRSRQLAPDPGVHQTDSSSSGGRSFGFFGSFAHCLVSTAWTISRSLSEKRGWHVVSVISDAISPLLGGVAALGGTGAMTPPLVGSTMCWPTSSLYGPPSGATSLHFGSVPLPCAQPSFSSASGSIR